MDGVLGQDKALETLRAQLASQRVHHAQIFHGPSGVGKFTTALAFTRVLLGEQGWVGQDHPDLHVVTKELALYSDDAATRRRKLTSIPVEVVREHVLGPAFRSAQVSDRKVFIIDEAELLNAAGQNALLKTLEEPPAGTTLILVTTSEDRLLPTIRSRCQRVAFVPLAEKHLSAYLDEQDEAGAMSESERAWLLRFASGSLGRLTLALEYGLTGWARAVLGPVDGLTRGRASPGLGGVMQELQQGFAEAWVKRHDNASKEAANQTAGALMAAMLTDHARHHLGLLAAETDPDDPEGAEARLGPWLGVIDAVEESRGLLARNVNPSLVNDYLGVALHAVLMEGAGQQAGVG